MIANDLMQKFKIYSFNFDLLPIDNDLLSLEKDQPKKDFYTFDDFDNIQRKIQVHFISFLVSLSNDLLKTLSRCFTKGILHS